MENIEQIYDIFKKYPSIVTDSRKVTKDCIFVALRGDNFDGNTFAAQALKDGAAAAIVDDAALFEAADERLIIVEDALLTLQQLALHHRRTFDIPVIGITGSNGKTTTKELVSIVLSMRYNTHWTKGNLNNHIGVPLTLLEMTHDAEVAVIEMGANHPNDINFLCRIAEPTHGLITNVGKAHLEGFGGFEGVKRTKSEMYRFLDEVRGTVFINRDEPFLDGLAPTTLRKVYYRRSITPSLLFSDIEIVLEQTQPTLRVAFFNDEGEWQRAKTQLVGEYNFGNIATAIALGRYFKVPATKIVQALEQYESKNNRSELRDFKGAKVILDAYNANPTSMEHALKNLASMPLNDDYSAKMAILGDMFELGEDAPKEHDAMFRLANQLNINTLVLVGENFSAVQVVNPQNMVLQFGTTEAAKIWFDEQDLSKHLLLIKGSRGMGLERLLK